MRLNCCQKAAIFSRQNRNSLRDLNFLSFDKSVQPKRGENLPNREARFGIDYAAAARARNGRGSPADDLLTGYGDVRASQDTELPGTAAKGRQH